MVEKLRSKPGGADLPVEMGSFANVRTAGRFSVIYVVFNTFFNLLTQEDQVRCFQRVAKRLTSDGAFVIEAFVPDLTRFDPRQRTSTMTLSDERTVLEASQLDPATQRVRAQHIVITDKAVLRYPIEIRYAWPAELDLMARLAGMRLRQRFGGWDRSPFTSDSRLHVSVYEPAPTPVATPSTKAKRTASKIAPSKRKRRA